MGEDPVPAAERLIAQLRDPLRYTHPAERVDLVETHISWVLLAGAYAYKIKKPLDLGFLDFSTLAKRRACCEEELRLNRRTAPELYLDVVPVTGSVDHPRLGGPGAAIEYAVCMRRFDEARLADRVAKQGLLAARDIDALARSIAAFHAGVERAAPASDWGDPGQVHAPARQNFAQIEALVTARADIEALERLRRWTETEYGRIEHELAGRKRAGFVRECHGDLHLGNIVLGADGPMLFDCIEFNPALRWIDVMSEVAFLVMDLLDHGSRAFAWRLLNAYLEETGDYGGVQVLRYYLVYRAMVRAKVATLRAHQPHLGERERNAFALDYRGYLELAERLSQDRHPGLAIMHGVSGSGKTTVSQALLEHLGAIRVRSDVERKRLAGLPVGARTGAPPGGGIYDATATRATYTRLEEAAAAIIASGYPAIADATFLRRAERARFRMLAASSRTPFAVVSCSAPINALRARIAQREKIGRDASEAGVAVLEWQVATGEPLAIDECADAIDVDTGNIAGSLDAAGARLAVTFGAG